MTFFSLYTKFVFFIIITNSQANDVVFNNTFQSNWTSLLFIIPIDVSHHLLWNFCKLHTVYYCLHTFDSNDNLDNKAIEIINTRQIMDPLTNPFPL